MSTIAYQGVPGSFSYLTAIEAFPGSHTFTGTESFPELFELIEKGTADFGVVPVENSLAGSVFENYDHLNKYGFWILGERYRKIEHYLLGLNPDSKAVSEVIQSLTHVYSHYKALEQCEHFFKANPHIQRVVYADTAGAAEFVSKEQNSRWAAIASKQAGKLYNLNTLQPNIEDDPLNYTRFVIIQKESPQKITTDSSNKCSLMFTLKHEPGTLLKALETFAKHHINLTKIESRPIHGKAFEYYFYADFEFSSLEERSFTSILKELEDSTEEYRIMGIYQRSLITNKPEAA